MFFFFKQKTAYEMRISDLSSDVCSSDLHDEDVHIVPFGVHKLRERIARHRSAPGYGLARLGELPHGKHGHAIGIGNRNELLVLRLGLCILTAQKAWLGRAINIGVNQPYLHSEDRNSGV